MSETLLSLSLSLFRHDERNDSIISPRRVSLAGGLLRPPARDNTLLLSRPSVPTGPRVRARARVQNEQTNSADPTRKYALARESRRWVGRAAFPTRSWRSMRGCRARWRAPHCLVDPIDIRGRISPSGTMPRSTLSTLSRALSLTYRPRVRSSFARGSRGPKERTTQPTYT